MTITQLYTDELISDARDGDTQALKEIRRRVKKGVKPANQRKLQAYLDAQEVTQAKEKSKPTPKAKKVDPNVALRAMAWKSCGLGLHDRQGAKITYASACAAFGTFPARKGK